MMMRMRSPAREGPRRAREALQSLSRSSTGEFPSALGCLLCAGAARAVEDQPEPTPRRGAEGASSRRALVEEAGKAWRNRVSSDAGYDSSSRVDIESTFLPLHATSPSADPGSLLDSLRVVAELRFQRTCSSETRAGALVRELDECQETTSGTKRSTLGPSSSRLRGAGLSPSMRGSRAFFSCL